MSCQGEELKNDSRVFCLQKCWKFSVLYSDFIHLLDHQRRLVSSWIYEHAVWERRLRTEPEHIIMKPGEKGKKQQIKEKPLKLEKSQVCVCVCVCVARQ